MRGVRVPDPPLCERIAEVFSEDPDFVLTLAGHRPPDPDVKPDDPAQRLCGMIRRVRWTEDRIAGLEGQLTNWIEFDRKQGKRKEGG